MKGLSLDNAFAVQQRHQRGHTVIAQPTRVNPWRHKIVAEGVHLDQRGHPDSISKIIGVHALGQTGARHRFCGQEAGLQSFLASFTNERKCQARKITATAYTSNDNIRVIICLRHLEQSLFPNNRLMEQNMVQDTAQ